MKDPALFKKENVLFILVQMIYWSSNCLVYGFLVTFLKGCGYSDLMCGLASTGMALTLMVAQPILGYLADSFISQKKLLFICFIIAIPTVYLIPISAATGGSVVILAVIAAATFSNPQYTIIDAWVVRMKEEKPYVDFGLIRSFAPVGYGLTSLIFGKIIAEHGFDVMFYGHGAALIITMLCMIPIPEILGDNRSHKMESGEESGRLSMLSAAKILAKNKNYVLLLIATAIYQFAMRPGVSLLSLVIIDAGGNSAHLGIAQFIGGLVEMPVILGASFLIRQGVKKVYLYECAICIAVIRMYVLTLNIPLNAIIACHILHAFSMGLYARVFIDYLYDITPKNISTTAATIGTALTMGIGSVIGNTVHGAIMASFGVKASLIVATFFMIIAALAFSPIVFAQIKESRNTIIQNQ